MLAPSASVAAQTVAALNHPNIVTIYAVEEADNVHFLTMELVEGKALSDLIPRYGLPLDQILELMIPCPMPSALRISAALRIGI